MTEKEKSVLTFPCDFTVKVMGKNHDDFASLMTSIIKKHIPTLDDSQVIQRPSKDHNYLALSITIHVTDKTMLDALYQDLTNEPRVLMAL